METKTLTVLTEEQFVEKQTKLYCDMLYRAMARWQNTQAKNIQNAITWETKYIYETGRKYFKVIKVEEAFTSKNGVKHPSHTSVEAFIDRQTGDVFKPASYKKPAKGARFNLIDQISCQLLFQHIDPFGGHLYANTKQNIFRGS